MEPTFSVVSTEFAKLGKDFHQRGWVLGTSGNFSAVLNRDPLRLAITPSGADKSALKTEQILEIDEHGAVVGSNPGKPSDERLLHLVATATRAAGAVLHTHSVWSTILSDVHVDQGGIAIEGYEMLKGLDGVKTHRHREWIPIFENDQDIAALAGRVGVVLRQQPEVHAFLLRRHGLYTWGKTLSDARRHVEILEFLLEAVGRSRWPSSESPNRG